MVQGNVPKSRRPASLAVLAWLRLLRFSNKVTRSTGESLRRAGLTRGQFGVLANVGRSAGISQQELAQTLGVTEGNICQLLGKMEQAGLLVRREEGHAKHLFLTERGQALFADMVPAHEALIAEQFSALAPEQQVELLGLLRTLDRTTGR